MKLFMLGDTHGNTGWLLKRIALADSLNCDAIVQLGDFGIWPGPSGDKFLRKTDAALKDAGLNLFFVDGNHEDFPKLQKLRAVERGIAPLNAYGNIWHIERGFAWTWQDTKFLALGGAVSIDRQWRKPGKSWWPQETVTPAEKAQAMQNAAGVDVFLTHDCPTNVPFVGMKEDPESHAHRQLVTDVAKVAKPKVWFHGHMHRAMQYEFGYPPNRTRVYGLDCDRQRPNDISDDYAILELPSLKVQTAQDERWLEKAY